MNTEKHITPPISKTPLSAPRPAVTDNLRNLQFEAWVATLPKTHWAKYDLSACRLGWEAALTVTGEHSGKPEEGEEIEHVRQNALVVEALTEARKAFNKILTIHWGWDGDCGARRYAEDGFDAVENALQKLLCEHSTASGALPVIPTSSSPSTATDAASVPEEEQSLGGKEP